MYAGPPTSSRSPELLFERHQIDRVAAFDELDHLVEDAAVRVAEEILRVDDLGREVEGVVVEEDRAENGSFGFKVVRERAFGDSDVWHSRSDQGSGVRDQGLDIGF